MYIIAIILLSLLLGSIVGSILTYLGILKVIEVYPPLHKLRKADKSVIGLPKRTPTTFHSPSKKDVLDMETEEFGEGTGPVLKNPII